MGTLRRFNLRALSAATGIKTLVETGTGEGQSVWWALQCEFKEAHSVELEARLHSRAQTFLKDMSHVHLTLGESIQFLSGLRDRVSGPKLIFLDAHFAGGADFELQSHEASLTSAESFPLLGEVRALQHVLGPADVLIVDDARMYQPGPFQGGECPEVARRWHELAELEGLFDHWSDSHVLAMLEYDQGYFCLVPKVFEEQLPAWINILPHDADLQHFEIPYGVVGVTGISIQRRLQDSRFMARYFVGDGLDVGGGHDSLVLYGELFLLIRRVFVYDRSHGDAQMLANVPDASFDFLYSSHCLEHLRDPREALSNWLRVVKPGGHLVIQVPDEDLYEQGVWPSRYNSDHKLSFTIAKPKSWSPVSVNVLDLVQSVVSLATPLSISLLDQGYRYDIKDQGIDQTRTPLAEAAIEFVLRKR
jgi:SAM-dependent methyltransferase